ncbi:MAG: UbiA prenyltransferase family protein [Bacteroidota bacterium]
MPIFFSGQLDRTDLYIKLGFAFFAFSFVASTIYVINDYRDLEADKLHPKKRLRPLASGSVSQHLALTLAFVMLVMGMSLSYYISVKFLFVLTIYFILNLGYTFGLKNISILDILIVAAGFVLRVKAGAIVSSIGLSHWIIIMVFLLALFMAIAKRRDDLIIKQVSGEDMRKVVKNYSLDFLNVSMSLLMGVIFVSYLMYTLSEGVIQRMGTYRLFYTSVFVLAGLLRYLQIALVENDSGSPTDLLLKDRFIQIVIFLWILSFYLLIYFKDLIIFS